MLKLKIEKKNVQYLHVAGEAGFMVDRPLHGHHVVVNLKPAHLTTFHTTAAGTV
jgi:hypothetical protein